jgi:hypothetical protein
MIRLPGCTLATSARTSGSVKAAEYIFASVVEGRGGNPPPPDGVVGVMVGLEGIEVEPPMPGIDP